MRALVKICRGKHAVHTALAADLKTRGLAMSANHETLQSIRFLQMFLLNFCTSLYWK